MRSPNMFNYKSMSCTRDLNLTIISKNKKKTNK